MANNTLKYVEVSNWLRKNIQDGTIKAGERLVSEHDLCNDFNISRHTARSAIAVLEKEGLVVRKQGSGTFVNLDLNAARKNIGVLLTHTYDYTFPQIISGIEEVLSHKGHRMLVAFTQNKVEIERNQLLSLLSANIHGLIVEAVKSALVNPNLSIYKDIIAQKIPVIFVNTYPKRLDCSYIINDDVEGGQIAAEYLITQGHSKIGGLFKHDAIQGALRYEGLINKLYEHNHNIDENRVIWYSTESLDYLFSDEQLPQLERTLSDCTAVICYSDTVAHMLIEAAPRLGIRIPDDLSLISFDDSHISRLSSPPITSITHPGTEIGKLAAENILKIIENFNRKIHHTYQPKLIVRGTVRKI